MPSAMVDTHYPQSDQAFTLRKLLGEPLADVLPVRLWCWGIETERTRGIFKADAKRLAEIVQFAGDCDKLLHAFLACEVIEATGKDDEYRIRGWDRNDKFFRERERLQKYNATRGKRVDHARKTRGPRVIHEDPSTSTFTSTPHSSSKNGGERASARETPPAPPVRTMGEARALLVSTEQAVELFEHWQTELEHRRGVSKALVPPTAALENAKLVLGHAGSDMVLAKAVVTAFVAADRRYWVERQHALWLLADPKDYEGARLMAAGAKPAKELTDDDIPW